MTKATLSRRLASLEQARPPLPWLYLTEDMDNPKLWRGGDGITYTPAELPDLESRYNVILFCWEDHEADPLPGSHVIRWDDDV